MKCGCFVGENPEKVRCGGSENGWLGVRGMFVGGYLNLSEPIGINRKVSAPF